LIRPHARRAGIGAALAIAALCPLGAERLALLPVADLEGASGGEIEALETAMRARLVAAGWEVASPAAVERALRERRLRASGTVPLDRIAGLLDELGATRLVQSTLLRWREGPEAVVALVARALGRDGRELWSEVAALSSSETEGAFGFGRIDRREELAVAAVERLFAALPPPGSTPASWSGRLPDVRAPRGVAAYRRAGLFEGAPERIALLPFGAPQGDRAAGRAVAELVARRLVASGAFELVESADLHAAMVAEGIPGLRFLTSERLLRLGQRLGTTMFLRGEVWGWRAATFGRGGAVEVDLELADVASGEILWSARHAGDATGGERWFGRPAPTDAVAIADRVVLELLDASQRARAAERPARTVVAEWALSPRGFSSP
jgi:hypothetical protein